MATVIPYRGAWLEYETDANDVFYVRIDKNRKVPITSFIRAIGVKTDAEIKELFGEEAYAEFDKFEYIRIHGQAAYDEKFGELEDLGVWCTWEPCHKEMLAHGIVGVENLGG